MKIKQFTWAGMLLVTLLIGACAQSGSEREPPAQESTATAAAPSEFSSPTAVPTFTPEPSPTSIPSPTLEPSPTSRPSPIHEIQPTSVPSPTGDMSAGQAEDKSPIVIFERSGGFVGDMTVWTLYGDGTIEVQRNPGNAPATVETSSVEQGDVQGLMADLDSAGFFQLSGNYMPKDPCCDRFMYELTVVRDGQRYQVETVESSEGLPPAVWESINLVQAFFEQYQYPTQ